ncbi:hypothetical protein FPV67DRAFT_1673535 [Lyophyllum atratum]|nr:hypothetical protein FPV67DRAFT_1673535 [Lyophyllum atratum]
MSGKKNAIWTEADETALLSFLWEKKAEAGDGGNFKKTTWKAAEVFMAGLFTGEGGPKTANSRKGKYARLRDTCLVIVDIKAQSGFSWDDELGASIGPHNLTVWEAYVTRKPPARNFANSGWVHFHDVHRLLPSRARGMNVFRPSQSQPEAPNDAAAAGASQDVDGVSQETLERPISNWSPTPSPERELQARQPTPPPDQPVSPQAPLVLPFTPAPLKRKESALSASSTHGQKQPRLSGAVGLHGIAAGFADFNETFRASVSGTRPGVESTPTRKKMAMEKLMLNEKHLTEDESLCLIDLFQDNVSAADTYLTIEANEPLRKKWVAKRLDN